MYKIEDLVAKKSVFLFDKNNVKSIDDLLEFAKQDLPLLKKIARVFCKTFKLNYEKQLRENDNKIREFLKESAIGYEYIEKNRQYNLIGDLENGIIIWATGTVQADKRAITDMSIDDLITHVCIILENRGRKMVRKAVICDRECEDKVKAKMKRLEK